MSVFADRDLWSEIDAEDTLRDRRGSSVFEDSRVVPGYERSREESQGMDTERCARCGSRYSVESGHGHGAYFVQATGAYVCLCLGCQESLGVHGCDACAFWHVGPPSQFPPGREGDACPGSATLH